jgi:hypothetical protein
MAIEKPKGWLDKYSNNVAATDATRVSKQLTPLNVKKVTQQQLDQREVQARRDRIAQANSVPQSDQFKSAEAFAKSTSATADKLRASEYPNIFDDYLNPYTWTGEMASKLGEVPLAIKEGNYGKAAATVALPALLGVEEAMLGKLFNVTGLTDQLTTLGKEVNHAVKSKVVNPFLEKVVDPVLYSKEMSALKKIHADAPNYFNNPEIARRLQNLEIDDPSVLKYPELTFSREGGSHYNPLENKVNINLAQANSLKSRGYDLTNHSIYDHEMGHWLQRESYTKGNQYRYIKDKVASQNYRNDFKKSLKEWQDKFPDPTTPEAIAAQPDLDFDKTFVFPGSKPTEADAQLHKLDRLSPIDMTTRGVHDNAYFNNAGGKRTDAVEPYAFLRETKRDMIDKGFLKDEFHRADPELIESYLNSKPNSRIGGIADKGFKNYLILANSINKFPSVAPIIGAGALGAAAVTQEPEQKKNGGWLEKYNDGGPVQPNYNDYSVSAGPGFEGDGYSNVGRNYSPAWGGQFQMGGSLPGATGSMYARVGAPSKGKDRNQRYKTDASAQNGKEMKFYQEGLDFKPKSISKNGSKIIKDDRGQWDHPGEITEIGSNQITMQGVDYPVLGISDTGDIQMMYPNQEYQYDGNSVTEYPMMAEGGKVATNTNMPKIEKTNKKSSLINKQEELPLYYGPNVFENCVGAGCSKLATTETANLYGVSYDALSPQDAWYKKAAVLKNKGKEIWDPSKPDYSGVKVGDFVSMDRFGHDHDRDVSPIKGFTLADNEKVEHVGTVIGRNEQGIPLIKHGSEHGKVYVQPITDLVLPDANDVNIPLYYKPKSIYRSSTVENLDLKNKKYYTKPGKIDPIVWQNPTEAPTENEKKYLDAINKNAPMQQLVYGLTPEETKRINEVSWGIFHNETKAGATSKPVGGKMIAASLLHAFGRDNAASLGDVQIKYDDLMFNKDGSISKTGRLMQEMGVNRDGLYSPLEHRKDYNDEVNSVAAALATSLDKIKDNPTKYKYNPDKNTVYGNIPVDEALATIYRLGAVGFKESALRKHLSYGKAAATHVNRDIEPSKKPIVNVGGQPLFAKLPKKEQGGQLTKLDQLTNFTNYNTKQPGGWLDKYQ